MKFKYPYFLYILFFSATNLFASHIAGGDITLEHVNGNKYLLKMTMFFDLVNGQGQALVNSQSPVIIAFYDKATNVLKSTYELPLVSYDDITVSSSCKSVNVHTRIFTYQDTITLNPTQYSNPQGFYGAWQGTYRNNNTVNLIISANQVGAVFYSEFPPLSSTYTNSSPMYSNPTKIGYACIGVPFSYDFSATDSDGDSLTYELVMPLAGSPNAFGGAPGTNTVQVAKPAPYATVTLASGYSLTNLIHGSPPLSVNSTTGILSFTSYGPLTGLYALSVRCNEYRNGTYLGSVTRDFQIYLDDCSQNTAPVGIKFSDPLTHNTKSKSDTLLLDFSLGGCLDLLVVNSIAGQQLTISATGIDFPDTVYISPKTLVETNSYDTSIIKICIPPCVRTTDNDVARIQLVVESSNDCTLPAYDTLFIIVKDTVTTPVIPKIRFRMPQSPIAWSALYNPGDTIPADLSQGICLNALYIDYMFKKQIVTSITGLNFSNYQVEPVLYNYNSTLEVDTATTSLCFPACFYSKQQILKVKLDVTATVNSCPTYAYDSAYVYIKNTGWRDTIPIKPEVKLLDSYTGLYIDSGDTITLNLMHPQCVNLIAYNASAGSAIFFTAKGLNFTGVIRMVPESYTFLSTTDTANTSLCIPQCPNTIDEYIEVQMYYISQYNCSYIRNDSLTMYIKNTENSVSPPGIYTDLTENREEVLINKRLSFDVFATSNTNHTIYLSGKNDPDNSSFPTVSGIGNISSVFIFDPSCKNLNPNISDVVFVASDSTCRGVLTDSVIVSITVRDTTNGSNVHANVITPNNDQVNDYFDVTTFPPDNCSGDFAEVEIYNRWGTMIYVNSQRDFKWNASGLPDGLYYYVVKYTNLDYKGWVMVQR